MSIIYSYQSDLKTKIRLGVNVELNTVSFGSTLVTFGVLTPNTYGKFDLVDNNKAIINYNVSYPGSGSLFLDIFSRAYPTQYKGRGSISLNDFKKLTITKGIRAPYNAKGIFNLSGVGDIAYARVPYPARGVFNLNGNSLTRKISVYGYYGDNNTPGTSGTFNLNGIARFRLVAPWIGTGTISLQGNSQVKLTYGQNNTQLFATSGESTVAFVTSYNGSGIISVGSQSQSSISKTHIGSGTFDLNGIARARANKPYNGSVAAITFAEQSAKVTRSIDIIENTTLFRFINHKIDNTFDTCDNISLTCDNQDSAFVNFVSKYPETTGLFTFNGTSTTKLLKLYSYSGDGSLLQLYGTFDKVSVSYSNVGFGTLYSLVSSNQVNIKSYSGFCNIFNISGSSNSKSKNLPKSTILYTVSGFAETKVELDFSFIGNGVSSFGGFGNTRKISNYTTVGFGGLNLYGELVYPDIRFVPVPTSSGFINIFGTSEQSTSKIYLQTFGTLLAFSFASKRFSKSTYVGIGSVHIPEIPGSSINNPFQIARTYVSIV